jgi:hypothetical protein
MLGVAGRMSAMPASPGGFDHAGGRRAERGCGAARLRTQGLHVQVCEGGKPMSADDRALRDVVDAAWVLGAVTRCLLTEDPASAVARRLMPLRKTSWTQSESESVQGGRGSFLSRLALRARPDSHGRGCFDGPTGATSTTPHWCRKADPLEGCGQSSPQPMVQRPPRS